MLINRFLFITLLISFDVLAQDSQKSKRGFDFFVDLLGRKGTLIAIGLLIFAYSYKNSQKIFAWVDEQTYGTRDYIISKLNLMHIEVEEQKVTYTLIFLNFGPSIFFFGLLALFGNFFLGGVVALLCFIIGWKAPRPIIDFLVKRRENKYQEQMVDAMNLLANGIRAGLSMAQSIGMVVDELPAPVSQEFNLVLQEAKIGVPLDEALENLYKRVPSEDNQMFVSSVNILRESGGNLAEVFDTIVMVIRERVRLQQKISTFVAQGMFQGFVIFAMPFIQILINSGNSPDYLSQLFTTPIGLIMFLLICGFSFTGLWVIMKIVKIKV